MKHSKMSLLVVFFAIISSSVIASETKYPYCQKLLEELRRNTCDMNDTIHVFIQNNREIENEVGAEINEEAVNIKMLYAMNKAISDCRIKKNNITCIIDNVKKEVSYTTCPDCRGEGKRNGHKCRLCNGRGRIKKQAYRSNKETKNKYRILKSDLKSINEATPKLNEIAIVYLKYSLSGNMPDYNKVLLAFDDAIPKLQYNQDVIRFEKERVLNKAIEEDKDKKEKDLKYKYKILKAKADVLEIEKRIQQETDEIEKMRLNADLLKAKLKLEKIASENN